MDRVLLFIVSHSGLYGSPRIAYFLTVTMQSLPFLSGNQKECSIWDWECSFSYFLSELSRVIFIITICVLKFKFGLKMYFVSSLTKNSGLFLVIFSKNLMKVITKSLKKTRIKQRKKQQKREQKGEQLILLSIEIRHKEYPFGCWFCKSHVHTVPED